MAVDSLATKTIAFSVLLHGLLALAFHLSPDEAHYALYASHLDWSYFDHPPLVGWVQWPGWALGGQDLLMRVVPMACWLLTAVGLVRLNHALWSASPSAEAPSLFPAPAVCAWGVVLLLTLSPLPHLLGLALVPDSLLMPLTCAIMLLTWRLCDATQVHRLPLWLALGLCLGLAGLAKYTAVLLALGAAMAVLIAHGPAVLKQRGPWLAVLLAGVLITPVIGWNATHDWISFAYQVGHAAGAQEWRASRVAVFALVQALAYGPLLLVGLFAAMRLRAGPAEPGRPSPKLSPLVFCTCFALPSLLLFVFLSGRGSTLPHWAAPAWVAFMPVAAAGCAALWTRWRKTLVALVIFQALACGGLAVLMLTGGTASEQGPQALTRPGERLDTTPVNPFADLYGWDVAARRAAALATAHGVPGLAVMNWTLANRIAWYARPLSVKVVRRHFDQFDLWFGAMQPGEAVLLVDWSLMSFAPPVGPAQFKRCDWLAQQPVMRLGRQIAHFNFLLCREWQGPVEPPLVGAR